MLIKNSLVKNPLWRRRIARFRSIKRGYYSLWIMAFFILSSLCLEVFFNHRALVVQYQGNFFFPVFSSQEYSGKTFGQDYAFETNYKELKTVFEETQNGNWLILPLIPYNAYENDFSIEKGTPPYPPNFTDRHLLGTDTNGRDILAILMYGFRIAIFFSLALYLITTSLGVLLGSLMGYFGGWFDLVFQRIVEVWTTLPPLYLIIILTSLVGLNLVNLLLLLSLIGWTSMTWLVRVEIYREKSRLYTEAARAMGASHLRIIVLHLLPNALAPIIASFPFSMVAGITALTSLDFLGYGLPIPTPSWGALLNEGQQTFEFAPWILLAPTAAIMISLLLFTFIGEAVRESFDPKSLFFYR